MADAQPTRDYFLAHATADRDAAERLFDLLPPGSAFLATRSVQLSDHWPVVIGEAQREALITVVLLSKRTEEAFYAGEEIQAAIALFRGGRGRRRVAPVYLEPGVDPPYGLRTFQGITATSLADAAGALCALAARLRGWQDGKVAPTKAALAAVTAGRATRHDLAVVTEPFRPGLITLSALLGLVLAGLVAVSVIPVEFETRKLAMLVLTGFGAALLGLLAWLLVRTLDTARSIALSGVTDGG